MSIPDAKAMAMTAVTASPAPVTSCTAIGQVGKGVWVTGSPGPPRRNSEIPSGPRVTAMAALL